MLALLTGVIVTFNGCNHSGNKSQAIIHHDTVYMDKYLPYYILNCSDPSLGDKPFYELISFCTEAIDDKKLFDLGKQIIDKINDQRYPAHRPIEYPDSFTKGGMVTCREFMWFEPTAIDTIRVKAIAHNDRDALARLEKYYHDNCNDKELAIYYKVLLSYEGNGDLAERFYRLLEPYFAETPELRIAVREVLLRAAYCDNDKRAQELCDSLGFSLCDYRLQIPE